MSHSPFACNWLNRFWDSEPIVAHFLSNKGGISNIQIPCNFVEMHPIMRMHVVCCVRGLGPSRTSKQFFFSLILLILLAEIMNQNRGIYRHHILYPL